LKYEKQLCCPIVMFGGAIFYFERDIIIFFTHIALQYDFIAAFASVAY